jgi:hypothetical protein
MGKMTKKQRIEDLTSKIYDTLMQNTMHKQFNIENVENPEVDAEKGEITFDTYGGKFRLKLEKVL